MSKSFMLKSLRLPILNLSLSECYSLCEISYRVIFTQFLQLFLLLPSAFASANHQAGSPGDDNLGNKVLKKFKEYGMGTWTDEHFVKVQDLLTLNKVTFKGDVVDLEGYLSYSVSGTVTVIYKMMTNTFFFFAFV